MQFKVTNSSTVST